MGVFLYGGLTVGTGMMGVSGGFYAGVGYKGVQSEHCCKNDQDFGTQTCEPDASRTPCPLLDSYKGYFLGGDVSVAIPPFGAGVLVAMSAGAVFEDSNLDDIPIFSSSLLSESGDIRDTSVSHVGNQAVDLAKEVHERDREKVFCPRGCNAGIENAGCFVTKPLPHLTKTIGFRLMPRPRRSLWCQLSHNSLQTCGFDEMLGSRWWRTSLFCCCTSHISSLGRSSESRRNDDQGD